MQKSGDVFHDKESRHDTSHETKEVVDEGVSRVVRFTPSDPTKALTRRSPDNAVYLSRLKSSASQDITDLCRLQVAFYEGRLRKIFGETTGENFTSVETSYALKSCLPTCQRKTTCTTKQVDDFGLGARRHPNLNLRHF